jgi:hypothetical protein
MKDLQSLINITVNYMKKNDIIDLLLLKETCSNPKSCWRELTIELFNEFDKINSLNIYNMWVRNTRNFRTSVLNILNNSSIEVQSGIKLNFLNNIIYNILINK